MTTEYMSVPYDEDRLTIEEQNNLEDFCHELYLQLENKLSDMGLVIVDGFGSYVTKFTQEELDEMEIVRRARNGGYEAVNKTN